jgi:hypothetical protein
VRVVVDGERYDCAYDRTWHAGRAWVVTRAGTGVGSIVKDHGVWHAQRRTGEGAGVFVDAAAAVRWLVEVR